MTTVQTHKSFLSNFALDAIGTGQSFLSQSPRIDDTEGVTLKLFPTKVKTRVVG